MPKMVVFPPMPMPRMRIATAVEPGLRLTDLGAYRLRGAGREPERLYQAEYPGMPQQELPKPRAQAASGHNLPLPLTRFFGRDEELADLNGLLLDDEVRLVTLTGPGGSGKTRLALEAARELAEAASIPVWFVELQDLLDAQFQLAQRVGRLRDSLWPLPSTVPYSGPRASMLDALSGGSPGPWPLRATKSPAGVWSWGHDSARISGRIRVPGGLRVPAESDQHHRRQGL